MTQPAHKDIGWELYRSYLGVVQEGSLSGAARALGVTQPTVGRHIAALEQALGLVLFTRSQQGLLPTEAALALRPYAQAMGHTAAALVRAADSHGGGVRGTVRVTASEVIGVEVLPPILAQLQAEHPALTVELVLSNRVQDLLQHDCLRIKPDMGPRSRMLRLFRSDRDDELLLDVKPVLWANHTDTLMHAALDGAGITATTIELAAPLALLGGWWRNAWVGAAWAMHAAIAANFATLADHVAVGRQVGWGHQAVGHGTGQPDAHMAGIAGRGPFTVPGQQHGLAERQQAGHHAGAR